MDSITSIYYTAGTMYINSGMNKNVARDMFDQYPLDLLLDVYVTLPRIEKSFGRLVANDLRECLNFVIIYKQRQESIGNGRSK